MSLTHVVQYGIIIELGYWGTCRKLRPAYTGLEPKPLTTCRVGGIMELTKICTKCPEGENVKPISEFGRHKRGKDGLRSMCKRCAVKDTQSRYTPRPRKFF